MNSWDAGQGIDLFQQSILNKGIADLLPIGTNAEADLQTLFADEMQVSNSPLGCPTEVSPLMVPVLPGSQTWDEWLSERNLSGRLYTARRSGKGTNTDVPGQLSIWNMMKEE